MEEVLKEKLLAAKSRAEFMDRYELYTGQKLERLSQIMEGEGGIVLEHFFELMKEERKGTPFGPHKLPDGREIYISPYIRESDKRSR